MLVCSTSVVLLRAAGEVYLVLGSDTAIWDGMNTGRYNCFYNIQLYIDPADNTYQVMNPDFRAPFTDSYGKPVKLTWWMMAGNIFRYAENRNMPLPNIMTLYLMRKYHGENVILNGDELSLHYHTFTWTDYDGDGRWWWNQARDFLECQEDFDVTLAQFLLEEEVFPVSFRSGWHYMDNHWQAYLNEILPFSMHNDWPAKRSTDPEPIDNIYDWSLAPAAWVPFHPSPANYQLPGNSPGWNVRSAHFSKTLSGDYLEQIFTAAHNGVDQVACIWGHLPETDFLENIARIDAAAHQAAAHYPDVKFRYCSAIEAMQRWLGTEDETAPQVSIAEIETASGMRYRIMTDEPIFQTTPFLAVKDIYENYYRLHCHPVGENTWESNQALVQSEIAKLGVAVCDSVGNQAIQILRYKADDIFIDNLDPGYTELTGSWQSTDNCAWGTDARYTTLAQNDTAAVQWQMDIPQQDRYNISIQVPPQSELAQQLSFRIYSDGQCLDTLQLGNFTPGADWYYLTTVELNVGSDNRVEMQVSGDGQAGKVVYADVLKVSALVRDYDLYIAQNPLDLGAASQNDSLYFSIDLYNRGLQPIEIKAVKTFSATIFTRSVLPFSIPPMSIQPLQLIFYETELGSVQDTLLVTTNHPLHPISKIAFSANVEPYFRAVDDRDSLNYLEIGSWYTSVAQAWGPSSRYAWLSDGPGSAAEFSTVLPYAGTYEIFEIVPKTVNSANAADYVLYIQSSVVDTITIDQNENSGDWVSLGRYDLPGATPIKLKVINTGKSSAGDVLRADAVKWALLEPSTEVFTDLPEFPSTVSLAQNFPNPFNIQTVIRYTLPEAGDVRLRIFNLRGELVAQLVDQPQAAGNYQLAWNAARFSSGVYLYELEFAGQQFRRKMMLVK